MFCISDNIYIPQVIYISRAIEENMTGRVHSFESFGTVDGPGIRFVVFMQGCPLRCAYCHNPDTWYFDSGVEYTVEDVVSRVTKYRNYYGEQGGCTVTGGEPLVQIDFVIELFEKLKSLGINTCIDTSGCTFDRTDAQLMAKFDRLMRVTDLVMLDIKHIDEDSHVSLTGKSNVPTLDFARYLSDIGKRTWIRHVLVPTITDDDAMLYRLKQFIDTLSSVDKIEVLPYHTMGQVKYDQLGISYRLAGVPTPTKDRVLNARRILRGEI